MPEVNQTEQPQLSFNLEAPLVEAKDWRTEVPSVSQLTRKIRGHIENTFFDVWVKGEISNFRKPISGHAYFLMKDATAQLRAVMFKGALQKVKFNLQDGLEVLLHGTISVYEARGEYQLVADAVEPVGQGALQLAFEQLKAKLHAEGLFDPKRKKPLPFLPKRVGVVTSATGAAIKDILKVLNRRFPNLEVLVIPANVQGEKAAPDIVRGIQNAHRWNQENESRRIDVLIVGRGGGSLEDLWPFNEEIVAREIYKSEIPIISAVGHEIDFTIADFVADLRAPTPSAAAEIVIPKLEELAIRIEQSQVRIRTIVRKHLEQLRLHVSHLGSRLVDPRQKLKNLCEMFHVNLSKLELVLKNNIKLARNRLESAVHMLHTLSPLEVIGRGYSLTTQKDKVVRSIKDLQEDSIVTTRLPDGTFEAKVLSTSPNPS